VNDNGPIQAFIHKCSNCTKLAVVFFLTRRQVGYIRHSREILDKWICLSTVQSNDKSNLLLAKQQRNAIIHFCSMLDKKQTVN